MTAPSNVHKKIGEDRACSSGDKIADRQTHTETHRHAHHNTPRSPITGEITTLQLYWLGSRVVSVLDRRVRVQIAVATLSGITVLGKLFTPIVPLLTKQRNWQQPFQEFARVTAGLAESSDSLPPGLRLTSPAG